MVILVVFEDFLDFGNGGGGVEGGGGLEDDLDRGPHWRSSLGQHQGRLREVS